MIVMFHLLMLGAGFEPGGESSPPSVTDLLFMVQLLVHNGVDIWMMFNVYLHLHVLPYCVMGKLLVV